MKENRQSPRIVLHIPLEVRAVEASRKAATAVVNDRGALIIAPVLYPVGTKLTIKNLESHCSTLGRVVWGSDSDAQGDCKMGIEFENPVTNFWGRIAVAEE